MFYRCGSPLILLPLSYLASPTSPLLDSVCRCSVFGAPWRRTGSAGKSGSLGQRRMGSRETIVERTKSLVRLRTE